MKSYDLRNDHELIVVHFYAVKNHYDLHVDPSALGLSQIRRETNRSLA